jgi:hypothetical protein
MQVFAVKAKARKAPKRRGREARPDSPSPADGARPDSKAFKPGMLDTYRALVLDSAHRPIRVVNWQRAVRSLAHSLQMPPNLAHPGSHLGVWIRHAIQVNRPKVSQTKAIQTKTATPSPSAHLWETAPALGLNAV